MTRALITARRLILCIVIAGLVGLPLALSWAITHTEVRSQIGTSPTTFTLSTQGHSEVRFGIAGTIYVPSSKGPLGVVATVDGPGDPGAGDGDLAGYVRPEMLELYAGLFHDPEAAVEEYVALVEDELRHQLAISLLFIAGLGGLSLYAITELLPRRRNEEGLSDRVRLAVATVLVLGMTSGVAWANLLGSEGGRGPTAGEYELPVLDDTLAEGGTTDSAVIRALLGGALEKARQLVDRQEEQEATFREAALAELGEKSDQLEGPREGEVAVVLQSDMHCNTTMIRVQREVVAMLSEQFGSEDAAVPALLGITGDLTTNGTAAEGTCLRNAAAIAGDAPVAAIAGNHETGISLQQMADAGMTVLDGSIEEVGGLRVLGDTDPNRSELFGATKQRGDETQEGQGQRLRAEAEDADDRPDLVLVHEAYAAQAFLGVDSVGTLLKDEAAPSFTVPTDDGIDDVPAAAVFYGHWHRSIEPRVIWNEDGTWTLLMELDTTGGAIDSPTPTNFSTPWSKPLQSASFPVVFLDEETRLVTGYQLYRFGTDATVTIDPRVDIGTP